MASRPEVLISGRAVGSSGSGHPNPSCVRLNSPRHAGIGLRRWITYLQVANQTRGVARATLIVASEPYTMLCGRSSHPCQWRGHRTATL